MSTKLPKSGYRALNLPGQTIEDIDTCPPNIDQHFWSAIPRTRKIQILAALFRELAEAQGEDLTARADAIR